MRFSWIAGALVLSALGLGAGAAEIPSSAPPADAAGSAAAAEATWQGRLADAIRIATSHNPDLARMDAEIRAAAERARQADALPDPEVSVGAMNVPVDTFSFDQDDMTMKTLSVSQALPPAGSRGAARKSAAAETRAIEREHLHHVAEVAARTAQAFFDLAALDGKLAIARETRKLLDDDARAAEERYRVGRGAQADVLRASLEKTRVVREIAGMEGERRAAQASFNAILARPADTEEAPIRLADSGEPAPDGPAFLARALSDSPVLRHYDAAIERAEEDARRARLERRPAWSLWGSYGQREHRDDMVSATVGLSLPWLHPSRLAARAAEADAMVSAARAERADAEYRLRGGVEAALAKLSSDLRQASLYRDTILPQAEMNERASREAYAVGAIDFATLVAASTDYRGFRSEYVDRLAAIGRDRADLQMASGLPLLPGTPGMEHDHDTN